MLIKTADIKNRDIETLGRLLSHPEANTETKKRIEQELRNIASGVKGEQDAAYEINFHFGSQSNNWVVIHDLRIEHQGRTAQIDHLLINRLLEVWVCESKRFSEGIAINERGECSMFWQGRPQGIPSPYEQNQKHIKVIKSLCDDKVIDLPKRLGFLIKPTFINQVIVSKNARVSRPKNNGWWDSALIKSDQIREKIAKSCDEDNNFLALAKLVSSDTLMLFARSLAALHTPVAIDWNAKFGLSAETGEIRRSYHQAQGKKTERCDNCNQPVPYNVAKYCRYQKIKFSGKIFCMACQPAVAVS